MLKLKQELFIICYYLTFKEYENLKYAINVPLPKHIVNQIYYFESIIGNWSYHSYDYWRLMEYSKHDYSQWMVINKSVFIDYDTLVLKLAHLNQFTELQRIQMEVISDSVRSQLLDFEVGSNLYLQILKSLSFELIRTSNAVKFASWYGYHSSITFLSTMDLDFSGGLSNAASKGYFEIVQILVEKTRDFRDAIFEASLHSHIEIVQFFLKYEIDSEYLNNGFITAVINRHVNIIQLFLKDERVDPNCNNHTAIIYSSECGFKDIVKLLLQDSRTCPSACENKAIKLARKNRHREIVEMIEQDSRYEKQAVETKYLKFKLKLALIKEKFKKSFPQDVMTLFALFRKY
ncbi:hypothetical protein HDV06_006152 [Boothiomyces sp. JEL0866]|nr:hypothetical protein HDV06_006152 [Boothiomyces sp. JEL0866]